MLHTFGGLALTALDGGEPVLVNQRKRLALIAALAADPNGGIARERLFALFWPESDGERSRNALNQIVFATRRDMGDEAILSDSISIRLNRAVVDSDLRVFREALADGRCIDAVETYRGAFLDGVYLRETPEFERWVSDMRRTLALDYARALEREIDSSLSANPARAGDAVRLARVLADHDPLSTHGALRLMRALERSGDTAAALRHAQVYATHLQAELESEPGPELLGEIARLRAPSVTPGVVRSETSQTHGLVQTIATEVAAPQRASGNPRRRRPVVWSVLAVAITILLTFVWPATENRRGAARPIRTGALTQIITAQSNRAQPAISPDGRWIAFVANRQGDPEVRLNMGVYVQQVGGARAFPIASDSTVDQLSPVWSPDGSRIAFKTPTTIQVVPALGGSSTTLLSNPDGKRLLEVGGWSHDGTRIAFADTAGVWVYDLRTARATIVTRAGFRAHSPTWSADDALIAYVVGTGSIFNLAPSAIWIVPTRGGSAVRVTDAIHLNTSPLFTPDRKSLLYVSNRDGARDIYQQLVTKGQLDAHVTRLTTGSGAANISLAADGRSLVYGSRLMRSNIWSAPISERGQTPASASTQVTFGDQEVECLSVSRDGQWLLYDSNRSGNQDIYKIRISGGDPVQLTTDAADDFCPAMSPNGEEIAFYSFRRGGVRQVFTMLAGGAQQQPILPDSVGEQQWGPSWSSDGNALVFPAARGGARHTDVVVRDGNGNWTGLRHAFDATGADWSPDGKLVAICGDSGLALTSPGEEQRRRLVARVNLRSTCAAWGPSPATVFFRTVGQNRESLFWSVPVIGGQPRLLLRLGDPMHRSRTATFDVDSKRLYFTLSSDAASIWRLELLP